MTSTVLAGIRFESTETLVDADDSGFADLTVTVDWVPPDTTGLGDPLPAPSRTFVWIDTDALTVHLPIMRDADVMRSWQLRQAAAVIAASFGRLTLHASAVGTGDSIMAFAGPTAAGKSTLAWALVKAGATAVSDDLLPIRFSGAPFVPLGDRKVPIAAIHFLSRSGNDLTSTPLDGSSAFQRHLVNGFGEHADPDTWAFQFDRYHALVEAVPHFDLVIPDDRARLDEVTSMLLGGLT